jgi:hypothetical protein
VLLVVDCALLDTFVCRKHCYTYITKVFFIYINLQEKIGTVTVEGVENVEEEDCTSIKTEQHFIQLVRTVKTEQEVSVLW